MAEMLVMAISKNHIANADKDRRGVVKKGYVINIKPDGWIWGKKETLPTFCIIKVPQVSVEALQKYLVPEYEYVTSKFPEVVGKERKIYRKRRWQWEINNMPIALKDKLAIDGTITLKGQSALLPSYDATWTDAKQYLRDLQTGLTETEEK